MPEGKASLRIFAVLAEGIAAFRKHRGTLLARSALLMAVPSVVILVWQSSADTRADNPLFFWAYLLIWFGSFAVAGYVGWPLARAALAAASENPHPYLQREDWWVRDGFVRTTATFSFTVAVGMVFLVIPGLMVLMIYTFYPFLIIDRRAKGFTALAASSELTKGNRIPLLLLVLILTVFFVPAGAVLLAPAVANFLPGLMRILVAWALSLPAISVAVVTAATAYQRLTKVR